MATLPNVYAERRIAQPSRAIAQVSPGAAASGGEALERLGGQVADIGFQIADREATAAAKEADAIAADKIRTLLYDPESGFANLSGSSAVAARDKVLEQIDGLTGQFGNLSRPAQRKLEESLRGRIERAKGVVDTHTSAERRTWVNGASAARIESAYQDSLVNPADTEISLRTTEQEIRGLAAREGWSVEETELEVEQGKSRIHMGIAQSIMSVDPEGAAAYLQENRGKMRGEDVVALERTLIPLAKEAEGRRLGAAAYAGMPTYQHGTTVEYAMGPNRPNKPAAPVVSIIGKSVEDVLGAGAKVVVTSGQEDEGNQHGSNRHGTGHAADVAIYRADGSRVMASDPEMADIARAAARNGALGIGFGDEYMGGGHIHIDVVEPGAGQANTWASGGKGMRDEIVGLIGERKGMTQSGLRAILDEPDPVKREAALNEYKLQSAVSEGEAKARASTAQQSAFEAIEAGNPVDSLGLDVKQSLGIEAMTSLRAYERSMAAGVTVETDPAIYMMLKQMEYSDPERFKSINLLGYMDKLSEGDRKAFIDTQAKPRDPGKEQSGTALLSAAANQMQAIGIDTDAKPGTDDAKKVATVTTQLVRWQDSFIAKNGREPTTLETDQQIGALLGNVVTSKGRLYGVNEAPAFEVVPLDNMGNPTSDVTIAGKTVAQADVQSLVDAMRADGSIVTPDAVAALLAQYAGSQP